MRSQENAFLALKEITQKYLAYFSFAFNNFFYLFSLEDLNQFDQYQITFQEVLSTENVASLKNLLLKLQQDFRNLWQATLNKISPQQIQTYNEINKLISLPLGADSFERIPAIFIEIDTIYEKLTVLLRRQHEQAIAACPQLSSLSQWQSTMGDEKFHQMQQAQRRLIAYRQQLNQFSFASWQCMREKFISGETIDHYHDMIFLLRILRHETVTNVLNNLYEGLKYRYNKQLHCLQPLLGERLLEAIRIQRIILLKRAWLEILSSSKVSCLKEPENFLQLITSFKKFKYQQILQAQSAILIMHALIKELSSLSATSSRTRLLKLSEIKQQLNLNIQQMEKMLCQNLPSRISALAFFEQSLSFVTGFQKGSLATMALDTLAKASRLPILKEELPPQLERCVQRIVGMMFVGIDLFTVSWLGSCYQLISGLSEYLLANVNQLEKIANKIPRIADEITLIEKSVYLNWVISLIIHSIFVGSVSGLNTIIPANISYIMARLGQWVVALGLQKLGERTQWSWINSSVIRYGVGAISFGHIYNNTPSLIYSIRDWLFPTRMSVSVAQSILNVKDAATASEIQNSFRKLALVCHPDKLRHQLCPKTAPPWPQIVEAREVLIQQFSSN